MDKTPRFGFAKFFRSLMKTHGNDFAISLFGLDFEILKHRAMEKMYTPDLGFDMMRGVCIAF